MAGIFDCPALANTNASLCPALASFWISRLGPAFHDCPSLPSLLSELSLVSEKGKGLRFFVDECFIFLYLQLLWLKLAKTICQNAAQSDKS